MDQHGTGSDSSLRQGSDGRTVDARSGPTTVVDAWVSASAHAATSLVEANRAALAAFGFGGGSTASQPTGGDGTAAAPGDGAERAAETAAVPGGDWAVDDGYLPGPAAADREPAVPSVAFQSTDWETELRVEVPGELHVGDGVRFSKQLSEADVRAFAVASGDTNRLHLDDAFAAETRFGDRIVHGTLVSGIVSAALARLPGLTIYLSQEVTFLGPVPIGERVTADVEVVEVLGGDRYRLATDVLDAGGESVVAGEATVLVDALPGDESAALPES